MYYDVSHHQNVGISKQRTTYGVQQHYQNLLRITLVVLLFPILFPESTGSIGQNNMVVVMMVIVIIIIWKLLFAVPFEML